MDTIPVRADVRSINAGFDGRGLGGPGHLFSGIADGTHCGGRVRQHKRGHTDLYRVGGVDGARVHVQQRDEEGEAEGRDGRVWDDVLGRR